jgi:hypothetical protein
VIVEDDWRVHLGYWKRRTTTRVRRAAYKVASVTGAPAAAPAAPIFIIGCPRSGTSLLFSLLRKHPELAALSGEGHVLWNAYQHPAAKGWSSDRATAADIRPREPRYLYDTIARVAGPRRFLDKTPKNCLKIPYLAHLFRNARFVLLTRNAPDTVSSLIEAWRVRQSPSYRLPQRLSLADYRGRLWSFTLPPGWTAWTHSSIPDVAALQYIASYETALADIAGVSSENVVRLRFEDLLQEPVPQARALLDKLELPFAKEVETMASRLHSHKVQVNSEPRPGKWRERADEIEPLMARLAPTMSKLGYAGGSDAAGAPA